MTDEGGARGALRGLGNEDNFVETLKWDYERTLELFTHLSDIRFKLASFIPILTGAAVALLTTSTHVTDEQQVVLSAGGLLFVLGIAIYDLRNSGIYNAMMGRLQALEGELGLCSFDPENGPKDERYAGPMRSRDALRKRTFYRLKVKHSVGTTLAYAPAFGAWAWSFADALVANQTTPVVIAAGAVLLFGIRYYTIDP